jgi:hypothetical protein
LLSYTESIKTFVFYKIHGVQKVNKYKKLDFVRFYDNGRKRKVKDEMKEERRRMKFIKMKFFYFVPDTT